MKRTLIFGILGLVAAMGMYAVPAQAQATRTWVSGVGDDVNPCSRTAPCKTFAGAISKTAAGGEINCLDSAGYGGLTITKAISVVCDGVIGGVLVSGTPGITVNAAATDNVVLKGLDFEGNGNSTFGVRFLAGASLTIQDCIIRNFSATNGLGVAFTPSTNAKLTILDTVVTRNGTNANGGGIQVAPTGSATASASLTRVTVANNFVGMAAISIGPAVNVMLFNVSVSNNAGIGIVASGAGATVRVGSSVITNNGGAATSGNVLSYLNNQINANNPDTTPTTAGGLK